MFPQVTGVKEGKCMAGTVFQVNLQEKKIVVETLSVM